MRVWTPQDVEAETLAGYWTPQKWPRNERLDAWNRAVVLGGEHYAAWREAHIVPMERAAAIISRKRLCLERHRIRRWLAESAQIHASLEARGL